MEGESCDRRRRVETGEIFSHRWIRMHTDKNEAENLEKIVKNQRFKSIDSLENRIAGDHAAGLRLNRGRSL